MRKALQTISSVAFLAAVPASLSATEGETITEACARPGVMAVVERIPGRCTVFESDRKDAPYRALSGGAAVQADEIIMCKVSGELRLTFCATRAQKSVRLKMAQAYRVPVVTKDPEEPKEVLDEAARVAKAKPENAGMIKNQLASVDSGISPEIPRCDRKLGTIAVRSGEKDWWSAYNLDSPDSLIRLFASKSNCFDVVEQKSGMSERALANDGNRQSTGRLKPADYLLTPGLAPIDDKKFTGILSGFLGHQVGALVGGIDPKKQSAQVVLTLTDYRSTEQLAVETGHANEKALAKLSNDGGFFREVATVGAGYANTEIGRVLTLAYLDSFSKLVNSAKNGQSASNAADGSTASTVRSVTVVSGGQLHMEPDINAKAIRDLPVGAILYPTGEQRGAWRRVMDKNGNQGWVLSSLLSRD